MDLSLYSDRWCWSAVLLICSKVSLDQEINQRIWLSCWSWATKNNLGLNWACTEQFSLISTCNWLDLYVQCSWAWTHDLSLICACRWACAEQFNLILCAVEPERSSLAWFEQFSLICTCSSACTEHFSLSCWSWAAKDNLGLNLN